MDGGWMVFRTRRRAELLAAQAVRAKGVETFVPMLKQSRGGARPKPLFPGYLFARLQAPAEQLPRVRSAPGVAYVLPRAAAAPAVLSDALVEAVRARASRPADQPTELSLKRGDPVTVVSGPFRWVEALFDRRMNGRDRIRILLILVHGSVALEVQADAIRPLRLPARAAPLRSRSGAVRTAATGLSGSAEHVAAVDVSSGVPADGRPPSEIGTAPVAVLKLPEHQPEPDRPVAEAVG